MERAAVLCQGSEVTPAYLPFDVPTAQEAQSSAPVSIPAPKWDSLTMRTQVEALETQLIREALHRTDDNKAAAARLLEISERALWYKIKRYKL